MNDFSYDRIEQSLNNLKLDISIPELATLASEKSMSAESLADIDYLLSYLSDNENKPSSIKTSEDIQLF